MLSHIEQMKGGTASYLMAMSPRVAAEADGGNTPENVKALHLGWMVAFLFVVSFVGLFSIVPLRKVSKQLTILCMIVIIFSYYKK